MSCSIKDEALPSRVILQFDKVFIWLSFHTQKKTVDKYSFWEKEVITYNKLVRLNASISQYLLIVYDVL